MMKRSSGYILCMFILWGCSKKEAAEKDTTLPIISVTKPASSQVLAVGQPIQISGAVTDDKILPRYIFM
jgi:hypothetical protein